MRHFLTILGHEVRMLLVNPSTYIAAVLFLAVMGFVFTSLLNSFSDSVQESSPAYMFFQSYPIPVLFMVPLLTMRCLAEERRLGTIETLLTTPVSTTEVVLGKYSAAYLLYLSLWASTAGFFYLLHSFSDDSHLLDTGPLIGGYAFVAVSGLLFVAVGVFASALSRNQAVAGILSFALLFALLVGVQYLPQVAFLQGENFEGFRSVVEAARIDVHFRDFCRGIIDTRQIFFHLSGTALMLILSILSVEAKLLHS